MTKKVKVYGIQRSGNNWLFWMLAANYAIKLLGNKYGHTHSCFNPNSGAEANLIISKHPVEWLPSMYRYENSTINKAQYLLTINKWNTLYASYLSDTMSLSNVDFIAYDNLLADPEKVLTPIAERYGLERKTDEFRVAKGHMGKQMNETERSFDPQHYLKKDYLAWYEDAHLEIAQKLVDWDVAAKVGNYKKI